MRFSSIKALINNTIIDLKEFSLNVAIGRIIRDCPYIAWEKRKHLYERKIMEYLKKRYIKYLSNEKEYEQQRCDKIIWVMWWQGIENMPAIVAACYKKLLEITPWRVVLIDKNNYMDWVNLSDTILKKHEQKYISTTHLSDIVRVKLLRNRGGLWVDATIWAKEIPTRVLDSEFYTLHGPGLFPDFITRGEWSSFFLFSAFTNNKLLVYLDNVLTEYWEDHNTVIDYLFIDFFIRIIVEEDKAVKNQINTIEENKYYYLLNDSINETYDGVRAEEIMNLSPIQKLSYKKDFRLRSADGKETNYSRIITDRFEC